MRKKWDTVTCDTSHATFIEISFEGEHPEYPNKRDFRTTRYPNDIEKVIDIQQQKLVKDIYEFVGGRDNMDELLEALV